MSKERISMRWVLIGLFAITTVACSGTGSIQQANEDAVVVLDRAGGYGDRGAELASEHCAKYGKVAVFESATGSNVARRISYLCK